MHLLPSELEAKVVIPSLRRDLSAKLSERGLKQTEIAEALNITQSAVSQYLKSKRAKRDIIFNDKVEDMLEEAIERIVNSNHDDASLKELIKICNYLRESQEICRIHRAVEDVSEDCDLCYS